jgi:acyl-lipid omega-6 desaturase (Delta-12 desaturase)
VAATGGVSPTAATGEWRAAVAPYARADVGRSSLDVATSVAPYLTLMVAMHFLLPVSLWLWALLVIPTAGFLVRTYIVFHDCGHGAFLPSRRANRWLGSCLSLFVYSNFAAWRHHHAVHHATAGDLGRRGVGDVRLMTVAEYRASPWRERVRYRGYRNPLVMFGLGPFVELLLQPRFVPKPSRPRVRRQVYLTNAALAAMLGGAWLLVGWKELLLLQVPVLWLAGATGIFLFYVQHQFEDVYWERSGDWDYARAALRGSSHLKLPAVLRFFTGNIGLHHVHHLSVRIPNYRLQRAHDELPHLFAGVPTLSLADAFRCLRLKLYDEERGRLVDFREAAPAACKR